MSFLYAIVSFENGGKVNATLYLQDFKVSHPHCVG